MREVPVAEVRAALERAAHFRCQAAIEAGEPPGTIAERIAAIPYPVARATGTDGWLEIGTTLAEVVPFRTTCHTPPPATGRPRFPSRPLPYQAKLRPFQILSASMQTLDRATTLGPLRACSVPLQAMPAFPVQS